VGAGANGARDSSSSAGGGGEGCATFIRRLFGRFPDIGKGDGKGLTGAGRGNGGKLEEMGRLGQEFLFVPIVSFLLIA
jgi:hypothetical protein